MEDMLSGHAALEQPNLSQATRAVLTLREEIIDQWKTEVRDLSPKTRAIREPILQNTLPAFYDSLALLLTPQYFVRSGVDIATVAAEHGGERARLTGYDTNTLIKEYQVFRACFFRRVRTLAPPLNDDQLLAIQSSIGSAIGVAASAFALAQAALHEHLIASLTHDLRSPLSNIVVAAELVKRMADSENIRDLAQRILGNAKQLDDMTRDLLDSIVFENGERLLLRIEHFDLAALVCEVAQHASRFDALTVKLETQPCEGYWCRASLRRALENLLGNAAKYGAPGQPACIRVACNGSRVQLSVHNYGEPIPPEQREHIFQIFRRIEAARQNQQDGWGIGLPYVRRVAESHGGSVLVSSSAESGTSFVLDMPIDARPFQSEPTLE